MITRPSATRTPLPTWEQETLFTGGYSLLTAELIWHLNGPRGTIELGYGIRATDTGEQVELGTLGVLGTLEGVPELSAVLAEIHRRAVVSLSPF